MVLNRHGKVWAVSTEAGKKPPPQINQYLPLFVTCSVRVDFSRKSNHEWKRKKK
jgi:hypothetical protein